MSSTVVTDAPASRVWRARIENSARSLVLTGSGTTFSAGHDLRAPIVEPYELDEAAGMVATHMAELAPVSLRNNRRALRALRRSGAAFGAGDKDRLMQARRWAMQSDDFAEGIAAFGERRSPRFSGR